MKQIMQQKQRLLSAACQISLLLLAGLPQAASAQQYAPGAPTANGQPASSAVKPTTAAAPVSVVAGAPAPMGATAAMAAPSAPAAPAKTAKAVTSTAPAVGIDPATGAPTTHLSIAPGVAATAAAEEAEKMQSSDKSGMNQGLKVHGHWEITVKNPDGSVAQHREFENSLSAGASTYLIGLLAGYFVSGNYMIVLGGATNAPCSGTYQFCGIYSSLNTVPATTYCAASYGCVPGLTSTYNLSYNVASTMVLSGSVTATQAGAVGSVYTLYGGCASTSPVGTTPPLPSIVTATSPSACDTRTGIGSGWDGPLTSTTLSPSIPFTSGQLVQVVVTISFS